MKKLVTGLLIVLIIINMGMVSYGEKNTMTNKKVDFIDIKGHWAEGTINKWIDKDLVGGYKDNKFKPDDNITMAEYITLINKIYGFYELSKDNYKDVLKDDWFYKEAAIAKVNLYMDWYKKENLVPNKKITREEVCATIANILQIEDDKYLKGMDKFLDEDKISEWSKPYVYAVINHGYISGYPDNTLKPLGNITRAEVLVLLDKVIGD